MADLRTRRTWAKVGMATSLGMLVATSLMETDRYPQMKKVHLWSGFALVGVLLLALFPVQDLFGPGRGVGEDRVRLKHKRAFRHRPTSCPGVCGCAVGGSMTRRWTVTTWLR